MKKALHLNSIKTGETDIEKQWENLQNIQNKQHTKV
jgi:hypothetical protein